MAHAELNRSAVTMDGSRLWGQPALEAEREIRRERQRQYAGRRPEFVRKNQYYYRLVSRMLSLIAEPGCRVLEIRCLDGQLLNSLAPSRGLGIDLTDEMLLVARQRFPRLELLPVRV